MLGLLAPWFLAGIAALGVPILVHLTQKERKEVIQFPSTMFLRRIPYQAVRRQQIRHWLLLLLRCLAILLLILAFTRPFFASKNALATKLMKMGKDEVILLDRSYSMSYGNRWERAQKAAKEAVDNLGANDRAVVVYFDNTATPVGTLTGDKASLRKAIDSVLPTAGATRYDVAFRAVQRIFGDTARPSRAVVLVSDDQRTGWTGRELPALPVGTTFSAVNLSDSVTANVFVSRVDTKYRVDEAAKQERVTVKARLANISSKPITNHMVTLEIGGREMFKKSVQLIPANGTAEVTFDELPVPPEITPGTVRSASDSLQRDNIYHFVVARKQPLSVLVIQPMKSDSMAGLFIRRALGIGDHPSFTIKTAQPGQVAAKDLKDQGLVILNNVPVPDDELGRGLTKYVQQGGALLVALGSRSDPVHWPSFAKDLMPIPSGAAIDQSPDFGATFGFIDRGHPIFEVFNGPRSGDFSAARFYHYWSITPGENDRQLARFGDGRPALVERRVGTGRVLVWTSDLDGIWNTMPLQPIFLPFLRQTATYAVNYKDERLAGTVGQVVTPATLFGDDVPSADSAAAHGVASEVKQYVSLAPDSQQVRFGKAGAPPTLELTEQGIYELKRASGEASKRLLAANVDLAESDLTSFDPALLETAVAPRAVANAHEGSPISAELQRQDLERGQGVWWYLLVLAFMLLGLEILVANRLSRSTR